MKRVRSSVRQNSKPLAHKTKVTWLNLGKEFGIPADVRRLIYNKLTSLERFTVEMAHGKNRMSLVQRSESLRELCRSTNLGVLRWMMDKDFLSSNQVRYVCENSTKSGDLANAKLTFDGSGIRNTLQIVSCESGSIEKVEWALSLGPIGDTFPYPDMVYAAVARRHIPVIEYIMEKSKLALADLMNNRRDYRMISSGCHMLKYLHQHSVNIDFEEVFDYSAFCGDSDCMDWAIENGAEFRRRNCCSTVMSIAAVQNLRKRGCDWGNRFLQRACSRGVELLDWAVQNGFVVDTTVKVNFYDLGRDDKLEMIQWLHRHNFQLGKNICRYAGPRVVKWLEEVGCPCGKKRRKLDIEAPEEHDDSDYVDASD